MEPRLSRPPRQHHTPVLKYVFQTLLVCLSAQLIAGEPSSSANVPSIRITSTPLTPGKISPYQYGQFIEYLCDLVPGLWAEKLYDGGFEGPSPYKFAFRKETDFREKPWYPSGAVNRLESTLDPSTKVGGNTSRKIEIHDGPPATAGLSQDGISIRKQVPCSFSIWLRNSTDLNPITATVKLLHAGRTLAEASFTPTRDWRKFNTVLRPLADSDNARLTFSFRGPGTLWCDNASLMPADSIHGWRRDAFEAVRALKPGIIRFGGSVVEEPAFGDLNWKDTIGDPDHRKPVRAWGGLQPAGPGLEEIVQFIQEVGAEPLICLRFKQRTPKDAADEVEYFNGSTSTPMGALRASNGHPAPYTIRYWQVGNEVGGPEYDHQIAAFCKALREVDPTIQILSSYPSDQTVREAATWLDFICPHHYGCADLQGMERDFVHMRDLISRATGSRPIKVAVTEWNTTAGDWGLGRASLWTLANALACSRYHHLLHRQCDLVAIANRSNLINSFCSGIIQTDNHRLYKTPTYYAQQLYATLAGTVPLTITPTPAPNATDSPTLDLSATLSEDGRQLTLFAVNDGLNPLARTIDTTAFNRKGPGIKVDVWTLTDSQHAGEPDAVNDFDYPERIAPIHSVEHADKQGLTHTFPPLSLTALRWSIR